MKYYQVGLTADPKIVGVKDGIYQVEIDKSFIEKQEEFKKFKEFFDYSNNNFWERQNEIENFKIPPIKGKLLKKAKITDIMGYTPSITFLNEIFSDKFLNIIKTFNTGNYSSFDVAIEGVNDIFHLLFFETIQSKDINFEHSFIFTGHKALNNIKYFHFLSFSEYWEFLQKNPMARFEKIAIPEKYFGRDIIKIQGPLPFYSDRLIDFLLDCGITNLEPNYTNSIDLEFV